MTIMKKKDFYTRMSLETGGMACRATGGSTQGLPEGRRVRGKQEPKPLRFSQGGMDKTRVGRRVSLGLDSLNDCGSICSIEENS